MDENTVKIAVLETKIATLTQQQAVLIQKIEELTAVMNKGRGAFAFALFFSGTLGAAFATFITHFFKG